MRVIQSRFVKSPRCDRIWLKQLRFKLQSRKSVGNNKREENSNEIRRRIQIFFRPHMRSKENRFENDFLKTFRI